MGASRAPVSLHKIIFPPARGIQSPSNPYNMVYRYVGKIFRKVRGLGEVVCLLHVDLQTLGKIKMFAVRSASPSAAIPGQVSKFILSSDGYCSFMMIGVAKVAAHGVVQEGPTAMYLTHFAPRRTPPHTFRIHSYRLDHEKSQKVTPGKGTKRCVSS
jgi:hypothetical protein